MATPILTCYLGTELTIRQLVAASHDTGLLELTTEQREQVVLCRKTLDQLNSDEKPVYGVSTGFGHLENQWIPHQQQSQLQVNLIRSHAIGTGDEVPPQITRTAMILLANSLAKGHSGIRIGTLERIIYYLHNDITPVSYTIGSLGASGDLAPLAHVALTLIGEGEVYFHGKRRRTSEVLEEVKLEPLSLEAKEGLALINGTHFITAYGLTIMEGAKRILLHSLVSSALSLEALRATDTPFEKGIADLRGHHGHKIFSSMMRQVLEGSRIIHSHKDPLLDHKTQDAYALRCIPQVMGAIWDAFGYLERVLSVEINAVTDNPLIFPQNGTIVSGGNFHAEPLGFPLETACMALVELGNITEARISRLVSPFTPELPAFLAKSPGIESGYMIAHYTVAALLNRLRGMAHPNITDNIPVSGNQEDHVSMAMSTAVRCRDMMLLAEEIVAFELMLAIRGLNLVEHDRSSEVIEQIISKVNNTIEFQDHDHVIHDVLKNYKKLVQDGDLLSHLGKCVDIPETFNAPK